jgi:hypothetical protein
MPALVDASGKPYPESMLVPPRRASSMCDGCRRDGGKSVVESFGAHWRVVCKWCGHVSDSGRGEPPESA